MEISSLSTEYIRVQVRARNAAGALINPTGDVVQMAFVATTAEPGSGDWKTASWETDGDRYYARALVGPGAGAVIALTDGEYAVWVKVTDNPEIPVKKSGYLTVT